jgi:hypothetical protein
MKKYTTLYYLLFVLIVMGAFAAMAQNEYGITILGLTATIFSLLFFIQLISLLSAKDSVSKVEIVELVSLFVLSGILAMRVFYIRFQFVEWVFALAGLALVLVYSNKMVQAYSSVKTESKKLGWLIIVFYGSIILYSVSMVTVPFFPSLSETAGIIAFGLLLVAAAASLISKTILINGERLSGVQFVLKLKDKSGVLIVLFLLFTCYTGFTKIGLIPAMYSNEFPQGYYELVDRAETGKEKPVDKKFRHEEFKAQYDRFIDRNSSSKKK